MPPYAFPRKSAIYWDTASQDHIDIEKKKPSRLPLDNHVVEPQQERPENDLMKIFGLPGGTLVNNTYGRASYPEQPSRGEIKRALQRTKLGLHPEKNVNASKEERNVKEARFKQLDAAVNTLMDPVRYAKYMDLQRNELQDATFWDIDLQEERTLGN